MRLSLTLSSHEKNGVNPWSETFRLCTPCGVTITSGLPTTQHLAVRRACSTMEGQASAAGASIRT